MPKRSPFTRLCSRLAEIASPPRADLHIHTMASDGEYTPEQVVALGRQAGLCAVAITDHDTLAGVETARQAAGSHIELVRGVEISAEFERREVHLLGYFIRADHEPLNAALARLCDRRRDRFRDFIVRLGSQGMHIPEDRVRIVEERTASLGRRHVVGLLLACQVARHRAEAFQRIVGPLTRDVLSKELLPLEEAISLIHAAGGVTSLAHPPEMSEEDYRRLAAIGLNALEVEYPWPRKAMADRLTETARRFGFATSGGSDCHGSEPARRRIGSHAIAITELEVLRGLRGRPDSRDSQN